MLRMDESLFVPFASVGVWALIEIDFTKSKIQKNTIDCFIFAKKFGFKNYRLAI